MNFPRQRIIEALPLRSGAHASPRDGMCAMEMVAYLAGEPHTDEPRCTCPVLAAAVRAINDLLPGHRARDRHLRRLLPRLINSRGSPALARVRAYQIADVVARNLAPRALEAIGRHDAALDLRSLPRIVGPRSARIAAVALQLQGPPLRAASWMLQRAADGTEPRLWVGTAARVARAAGHDRAWALLVRAIEALLTPRLRRGVAARGAGKVRLKQP
ncbi:MAG: hypothetical protein AAF628_32080 [Planctomycetota bacterium]